MNNIKKHKVTVLAPDIKSKPLPLDSPTYNGKSTFLNPSGLQHYKDTTTLLFRGYSEKLRVNVVVLRNEDKNIEVYLTKTLRGKNKPFSVSEESYAND